VKISPRDESQTVISSSLGVLLLLCGDIHLNAGPATNTFQVCTLNIRSLLNRSLLNPLKFTAISDLAEPRPIDLFALTETNLDHFFLSYSNAELLDATPSDSTLIS